MTFDEIFKFLDDNGVKRIALGKKMFGAKRWRNVYKLKMPTTRQAKQLESAKRAAEELAGKKMK